MGASYHAIVIGGGHNGLVAGSYLARSGARTVVLEARSKVGGAVDTSAPFADHPEIKVSTYSYVMSLMPAFLIEQLELAKHGYHVTPFGPYYQAFPDGRSITIYGDDPKKTYESVSQSASAIRLFRPSARLDSGSASVLLLFRFAALAGFAAHLLDDLVPARQRRLRFEDLGDVEPDAPSRDPSQGALHVVSDRLQRA